MGKLLVIGVLTTALAGCGGGEKPASTPTPSAAATEPPDEHVVLPDGPSAAELGYSQGVQDYYGNTPVGEYGVNEEITYHQPPKPAEAGEGEAITLTGTNLGIRLKVTVTGVERTRAGGKDYTAVNLHLENTGTAIYDNNFRSAALTYAGDEPQPVAEGVKARCSNGFEDVIRLDTARERKGCLLFPGSGTPETFQFALELVPTEAGGIWNLSAH